MKSEKSSLLGILGGLGPMATVRFYEMLTLHTRALRDQDHIDLILSGRATTPDRTAYLLGESRESPLPAMKEELSRLIGAGADLIVMPCNTAHFFYEELARNCPVPFLNIVEETVRFCAERGWKRLGILATEGTLRAGTYEAACRRYGIEAVLPSPADRAALMELIYGAIKRGLPAEPKLLLEISRRLPRCDTNILACTELSLCKKRGLPSETFTDSMEVLSLAVIRRCGKFPTGYDFLS